MIRAGDFVECARGLGYQWYTGVPCSFLSPLIDYTIADTRLHYLPAANEGDAVASAAGAVLGGGHAVVMLQNSGLGNAVNPLTSLTPVFRIPLLLIVTLRGDPRLGDEPQHRLMGRLTPALLQQMRIPWSWFPTETSMIEDSLRRALAQRERARRPYALIMRKGDVAPADPPQINSPADRKTPAAAEPRTPLASRAVGRRALRREVLQRVVARTPTAGSVVIATAGYTGRELSALADRPNQLYLVGSMGCASSLALGLALARPTLRVVVIDGDGAALMRLGNFATIGACAPRNLVHILLDNEAHESTGGQASVSAGVSFAAIAAACGYPLTLQGDDPALIDTVLANDGRTGPRFLHLKIRQGVPARLPRPALSPEQVRDRLVAHLDAVQAEHGDGTRQCR